MQATINSSKLLYNNINKFDYNFEIYQTIFQFKFQSYNNISLKQ